MASKLEAARPARVGASGWLTRQVKSCDEMRKADLKQVNVVEYEALLVNFENRLSTWDDAELLVESLVDDSELEDVIDKAAAYRDNCERAKLLLVVRWNEAHANQEHGEQSIVSEGRSAKTVRLPKMDLPKFNGDVLKFLPFWQQYVACVDSVEDLPDISKFNYLVSSLKGDAKGILEGLPITTENYAQAKDIVQKRYGRKELIIFAHVQALMNLNVLERTNLAMLTFRNKLVAHVRSLEALDIKSENSGVILTPIIVSRLPEEIRLEWSRDSQNKEADLDYLMDFLEREISRRDRCELFGSMSTQNPEDREGHHPVRSKRESRPMGSAAALQTGTFVKKCDFCGKAHYTQKCFKYLNLPVTERQTKVFENKLCFRCLLRNHVARSCKKCCSSCKGAHHESFCYGVEKTKPKEERSIEKTECDENATLSVHRSSVSFLPIATVKVKGEGGKWVEATLLFDSGSDQSYVTRSLVRKTNPKWVRNAQSKFSSFGGHSHKTQSGVYEINIKGVKKETEETVVQVTEVPVICLPLARPQVDTEVLQKFDHLNLAMIV